MLRYYSEKISKKSYLLDISSLFLELFPINQFQEGQKLPEIAIWS